MRFKTSFFIDESIDDLIDARARRKGRPKSHILQSDLEMLYFCLDMGIEECRCVLTAEQLQEIEEACAELTDDKAKTNFIMSGCLRNNTNRELRERAKQLSKLCRLSILDQSEIAKA